MNRRDLPLCDLTDAKRKAKRNDSDISGCRFANEVFESEDLSCLSFINCLFENCVISDCDLERSSFVDVTFTSCDLSNSTMDSAYFSRCEFVSSKLVGAQFNDCSIQSVQIDFSNCGYAIFDKCRVSDVLIKNTDMSSAELVACNLKAFKTSGSKYLGTSFFRTPLGGIDFSNCIVSGLRVSDTFRELRNAVFSANQAVELSLLLGIRIK